MDETSQSPARNAQFVVDTPQHYDSIATVHEETDAPLFWTTYICTVTDDTDVHNVAGTCAWIATVTPGTGYCWVDAQESSGPRTVVCTLPSPRSHKNHEAVVWLLRGAIRRCFVIESETNLTRPRLRVYSFLKGDEELFDAHHSPSSGCTHTEKYEAKVDNQPIPSYLRESYDCTVPVYIGPSSAPTVTLDSIPAPTSGGVHDVLIDPDPSVVYACTGTVEAPDPDTRIRFDVEDGPTPPVATDGGS
jgi:hypothetical protein